MVSTTTRMSSNLQTLKTIIVARLMPLLGGPSLKGNTIKFPLLGKKRMLNCTAYMSIELAKNYCSFFLS